MSHLLEVEGLTTVFTGDYGETTSVDHVSFHVDEGEVVCIVGESGCGKSVTNLSVMGLLSRGGKVTEGKVLFEDRDLLAMSEKELDKIRGDRMTMIFQDPLTSLNPVFTVGNQIMESLQIHRGLSRNEAGIQAEELLSKVGMPDAKGTMKKYPHTLSGGMRQRAMIAMALSCKPKLLIADEPTTALDVTIQAQIIELLKEIQKEMEMSILLITHDFGVVSQMADTVSVMYAGKIVEQGSMKDIFEDPWHPYTRLLIMSIPGIKVKRGGRLETIEGAVPNPMNFPPGCRFYPRCPYAEERCMREEPVPEVIGGRMVRCLKRGVHDGR